MRTLLITFTSILLLNCADARGQSKHYSENAILVLTDGEIIQGAEKINDYYKNLGIVSGTRGTIYSTSANSKFDYVISTILSGNKPYKFITVTQSAGEKLRVFEVVAEFRETTVSRDAIDKRRDEWIKICNQHDSGILVRELYSENPIYYNHKPLVTSPEALTREYSYMNNPNYSLHLDPLHVEMISAELAFEIGQCSGSYKGKYVIVWKKDGTGKWKVMVDSNI